MTPDGVEVAGDPRDGETERPKSDPKSVVANAGVNVMLREKATSPFSLTLNPPKSTRSIFESLFKISIC